jgi:hypothetical protein
MLAFARQATGNKQQATSLGGWTALMLAGGVVGQTSIVNTLCHLHTPVILSLWRVVNGVILGLILGVIAWWIVGGLLRKEPAA